MIQTTTKSSISWNLAPNITTLPGNLFLVFFGSCGELAPGIAAFRNAEVASGEKKILWSSRAVRSFAMAELEARKMRYPTTGTEGLLMGILVEGTSDAAKLMRASGITLLTVREEAANVLGKSEMFYFSPMHPPLTEAAQRALDWALNEKLKSGEDGEVTANHLFLGIWSDKESAGHKILASLGFDDEKASLLAKTDGEEAAMSPR